MIAKLGLGLPKDILVDPQLFAVRTIDIRNNLERLYQRFYFNMDREKFDRWLVSIIPSGIDKKFNSVFKSFEAIPGGYELRYIHGGEEMSERTRVIVGAEGFSYAFKSALYFSESLEGGMKGLMDRYSKRANKIKLN